MSSKPQLVGKIIIEYLSDERWHNLPSLTLARKIYNENKSVFASVETVRASVRYYRGAAGDNKRASLINGGKTDFIDYNPYTLPESDEGDWYPFRLPQRATRILNLSDIHIPYHNLSAVNAALNFGIEKKVNAIILDGDIIDCYQVSQWVKDPRKRHMAEEIQMTKDFLSKLRELFPDAYIFYKPGNHEERLEKYLMVKAPELLDLNVFELKELLDFNSFKIETIEIPKQILKVGKLNVVHGHEFGRSIFSPVNPARGLFMRAKCSVLAGHNHQTSEHTEPNMDGDVITTWSQGCLCHDDKTEILTDSGFKLFDVLNENDLVCEYDKTSGVLEYVKPVAYQKYVYNDEMYRFTAPRLDQLVTPSHKMLVSRGEGNDAKDMTAEGLYERKKILKTYIGGKLISRNHIEIDVYLAELIGFIITDGSYRKGSNGIRIYQKTKFERVKYLLEKTEIEYTLGWSRDIPVFNIPARYGKAIREMNPIKNRISRGLLNCDYDILCGLYEGLIGGDGHRNSKGTDYFSTHDIDCANEFQELCCKIGYSVLIKKLTGTDTNLYKGDWYIYKCYVRKFSRVDIKEKNIEHYRGFVYDVTTTTGYFIIRRNGKVSVSGNCDLHPEYFPINKWNHGFAYIELSDRYKVTNIRIIDGQIV